MEFFSIENIAFSLLDYTISYVELIGVLFGLLSVYLATQAHILTWPTGIVNEAFAFILFFQIQLYPDMFLQVYFFVVNLYGWYNWRSKSPENKITSLALKTRLFLLLGILAGTLLAGYLFSHIHELLPAYFPVRASFPYIDSFIMVSSIVATVLLARKNIENWYIWIFVDVICVFLYLEKDVLFLSLEYLIFLGLASYGAYSWKKQLSHD